MAAPLAPATPRMSRGPDEGAARRSSPPLSVRQRAGWRGGLVRLAGHRETIELLAIWGALRRSSPSAGGYMVAPGEDRGRGRTDAGLEGRPVRADRRRGQPRSPPGMGSRWVLTPPPRAGPSGPYGQRVSPSPPRSADAGWDHSWVVQPRAEDYQLRGAIDRQGREERATPDRAGAGPPALRARRLIRSLTRELRLLRRRSRRRAGASLRLSRWPPRPCGFDAPSEPASLSASHLPSKAPQTALIDAVCEADGRMGGAWLEQATSTV